MFVCLLVLESVISDNLPSEVWCEAGNYNLGPGPSSESVWPGLSRSQTSIEASKTNLATLGLPRSSRGSCITGWRRGQVWAWCLYWWESHCTKCTQSSLLPLTPGPGAGLCHGHPRHHGQAVQEARHHRGGHQPVPCGQLSGKHQSRDCEVIWWSALGASIIL